MERLSKISLKIEFWENENKIKLPNNGEEREAIEGLEHATFSIMHNVQSVAWLLINVKEICAKLSQSYFR